jgi:hypothetical protein
MTMSNMSEKGVSEVKATACDRLLATRVESRISGKKVDSVMNRLQVFHPEARDGLDRDICIPESVQMQAGKKKIKSRIGYAPSKHDDVFDDDDDDEMDDNTVKKTARDLMWENGGPGVWAPDYRESYDLKDPEWRFDAIPEVMDGKNIMDFVDPDIDAKLAALEKEEDQLAAESEAAAMGDDESDLDEEEEERWAAAATAAAATSGGGSSGASARAELPEDFVCPITFEIMADPVITIADGETYERAAIEDWFARGNRTAPRSNEPLGDTTLVPNKTLKRAITTWREQHHE